MSLTEPLEANDVSSHLAGAYKVWRFQEDFQTVWARCRSTTTCVEDPISTGVADFSGFHFQIHALIDKHLFQQLFTRDDALYKIGTATEKVACKLLKQKVWLPGMGSNHELDRILKSHNLSILQSR
jgi:hypothetical protein